MTELEYVQQEGQLGHSLHENAGIWWQQVRFGYCKPVFEFHAFPPGKLRPRFSRSFLGYSHQVVEPSDGNRSLDYMVLEGENLRGFSMQRLRSEKRNQVRKGLKSGEVRLITDLEPHLERVRQINISQAKRQMEAGSFGKPAQYYQEQAEAWRAEMRQHFSLAQREWWGWFAGDVLGAYMITFQVASVGFVSIMKTHSEVLKLCATDAIYFTVLERAGKEPTCERIINGGPQRPSLDRYKEQFLFERRVVPYYTAGEGLFRLGARLHRIKETLRLRWQSRTGGLGTSTQSEPPPSKGKAAPPPVS